MHKLALRVFSSLIFLTIILVIIFRPPEILFYHNLQYVGIIKRAIYLVLLCFGICLYRVIKGPKAVDRIAAINLVGILIVGFCALLTIATRRSWYLDIAIAWAIQSFITTLAFAKYVEGKNLGD